MDQQRINEFSRLNARQTEAEGRLEALRTEKEQVDEVLEEVQMLEMSGDLDAEDLDGDEDDKGYKDSDGVDKDQGATGLGGAAGKLPFKVGDAFVYVTLERATEMLEAEQKRLDAETDEAEAKVRTCEETMKKLKVDLYAKFGNNISALTKGGTRRSCLA